MPNKNLLIKLLIIFLIFPVLLFAGQEKLKGAKVGDRVSLILENGSEFRGKIINITDSEVIIDMTNEGFGLNGSMGVSFRQIEKVKILGQISKIQNKKIEEKQIVLKQKEREELLKKAEGFIANKDYKQAMDSYRMVWLSDKSSNEYLKLYMDSIATYSIYILNEGNDKEAMNLINYVFELGGDRGYYYFVKGQVYYFNKQYRQAEAYFRDALKRDKADPNIRGFLGLTCFWLDKLDEARDHLAYAVSEVPTNMYYKEMLKKAKNEEWGGNYNKTKSKDFILTYKGDISEEIASEVLNILGDAYKDVKAKLKEGFNSPVRVTLQSNEEYYSSKGVKSSFKGHYNFGERKIHIPIKNIKQHWDELKVVMRHEITHVVLYDVNQNIPRWIHEGIAMSVSGEVTAQDVFIITGVVSKLKKNGKLVSFDAINSVWDTVSDERDLYYQSWSFINYMINNYTFEKLIKLVKNIKSKSAVPVAFKYVYNSDLATVEKKWQAFIK